MNSLVILGHDIEAITTATVMASLGYSVSIVSPTQTNIHHAVQEYAFDYQLNALWQLYVSDNKIRVKDTISFSQENQDAVWLFSNSFNFAELSLLEYCQANMSTLMHLQSPIFISGALPIGEVNQFANKLISVDVFYIPFVFLIDGASFASMLSPKLLLIGEKIPNTANDIGLLAPLRKHAEKFQVSDIKTTEFTRSSMMAMLATRLSFVNEMSRLADAMQIDIKHVTYLMGLDTRIGKSYLNASSGFGGVTLPKELALLQNEFKQTHTDTRLIQAIADINNDQKELIFRKFWQYFDSFVKDKRVIIWGAGYKAGSGKTENAAIHPLLQLLWQYNITTYVYDAHAAQELKALYADEKKLHFLANAFENSDAVDAVFILNYPDATRPSKHQLAQLKLPVFDAQNLLTDNEISQLQGFYTGIGRQKKAV